MKVFYILAITKHNKFINNIYYIYSSKLYPLYALLSFKIVLSALVIASVGTGVSGVNRPCFGRL